MWRLWCLRVMSPTLPCWIFEFGEEEGLMRAIDEMLASEVPWKGDVLQVHLQVSRQPTEKEEVCFV